MVYWKSKMSRSFFYAIYGFFQQDPQAEKEPASGTIRTTDYYFIRTLAEVELLCVQRLHWHVQSASSAITILQRRRRLILTEWKSRSIADSAELIHCIRKQNKQPHQVDRSIAERSWK